MKVNLHTSRNVVFKTKRQDREKTFTDKQQNNLTFSASPKPKLGSKILRASKKIALWLASLGLATAAYTATKLAKNDGMPRVLAELFGKYTNITKDIAIRKSQYLGDELSLIGEFPQKVIAKNIKTNGKDTLYPAIGTQQSWVEKAEDGETYAIFRQNLTISKDKIASDAEKEQANWLYITTKIDKTKPEYKGLINKAKISSIHHQEGINLELNPAIYGFNDKAHKCYFDNAELIKTNNRINDFYLIRKL